MKTRFVVVPLIGVALAAAAVAGPRLLGEAPAGPAAGTPLAKGGTPATDPVVREVPEFLGKGIAWLAKAQHADGGWGAGSHARQDVRDAQAVQTDPATTAFAGLALVRAGHTPTAGEYRGNVLRAIEYLALAVEKSGEGPKITSLEGTQPQTKMGPLVDTSLAVQFLSRVVPMMPKGDALTARADAALDRALGKLRSSQAKDGEWGRGGWANALQGSLGAVALEMAANAGKDVPADALRLAREAQQKRLDPGTARADASGAAGVELYAWAGAGRNSAAQSREALDVVERAKADGRLPADAGVSEDSLRRAGVAAPEAAMLSSAYEVAQSQSTRLADDRLLQGFGNNGGEEYLSYMMTSEALVIRGGDAWTTWRDKMRALAEKAQSADGSWTGHHCITSPVFCTAAVVQTLTAEFDAVALRTARDTDAAGKPATPR